MKLKFSGRTFWWAAAILIVAVGLGLGIGLGTRGEDPSVVDGVGLVDSTDLVSPDTTVSTLEITTTTIEEAVDACDDETESGSGDSPGLEFILALDNVLWLMEEDHGRLMVLTRTIDDALPDVPEEILDELDAMADELAEARQTLEGFETPPGQEAEYDAILRAAGHMEDWIDATSGGVKAGRSSGSAGAARVYLEEGDQARNDFEVAMAVYWMNTAPT